MSNDKIMDAIDYAVGSNKIENLKATKQELDIIEKALRLSKDSDKNSSFFFELNKLLNGDGKHGKNR